jgi:hypothetical protein
VLEERNEQSRKSLPRKKWTPAFEPKASAKPENESVINSPGERVSDSSSVPTLQSASKIICFLIARLIAPAVALEKFDPTSVSEEVTPASCDSISSGVCQNSLRIDRSLT